ncbi:MAG: PilZ domain-containing protein, partial [Syntrophobacteria bacterium]
MEEDGRQHQRAKVSWPVTIQTEEGTIERATYNISPHGAFISGLSPLELHEVVDITISGPDHPITVKARVVW